MLKRVRLFVRTVLILMGVNVTVLKAERGKRSLDEGIIISCVHIVSLTWRLHVSNPVTPSCGASVLLLGYRDQFVIG